MLPMTEKKIFLPTVSIAASLALFSLAGCGGGGGGTSATASGMPDEEHQVVDLPDDFTHEEPDLHETPVTPPQNSNLLNDFKFTIIKAREAWEGRRAQIDGYTGDGVVIGIMEEVNSFHPDLANKIHEASVLTSPYPANAPVPDESLIVDEENFTEYPTVSCLLQYGLDCPDDSGSEKYFLRLSDGELRLLPGLFDHCRGIVGGREIPCQRVTIGNNDPKAPEFGAAHGTGVASVAAGDDDDDIILSDTSQSLQGVAYDADILVYARPLSIAGLVSSFQDHADYFLNAPDEADVYNFSHTFGTTIAGVDASFGDQVRGSGFAVLARAIRDMGRPFIAATGNEGNVGEIFPRFPASLPAFFPELRGQVLAVTAVGSNGRIASYANPCGALPSDWNAEQHGRHYCLAAPGGDNNDLFWVAGPENNHYSKVAGTSFAAPMVAGAFAILKEQFRDNLDGRQIIDRLMETASRAEIYDDETLYGAGLLDLESATDTVGNPVVSTSGDINEGIAYDFDATLLSTSAAFGDALQRALQTREIVAFDELGAPFWYPLASITATTSNRETLPERRARLLKRDNAPFETAGGGRLALASKRSGSSGQIDMSLLQPVDISLAAPAAQAELLLTAGDLSAAPLGLHEDKSFAHPYLRFAGEGVGLGGSLQLGAGRLTAMGFTSGGASVSRDIPVHARGGLLEYAFAPFADVELGLQAGAMVEESRALGLLSEGGFGEMGESSTAFAGVSLDGALEENWRFRASMLFGRTNLDTPSAGLLATSSSLASSAFRFALAGSDVFLDADRIDVFVAQPLRIESGEADFIIPVGRTPSGLVTRERINGVPLDPSGRELEFGTRYEVQVREDIVATGGIGIVHEGGHSKRQETELYGLANLRFHF